MRRAVLAALVLAAGAGSGAAWVLTAPEPLPHADFTAASMTRTGAGGLPETVPGFAPDPARGEMLFHLGGCASCHASGPAEEGAPPPLGGGMRFATDFGTFVAPNISPSADGIGAWTDEIFANALLRGVGPSGEHLYPAFPYTAYGRMTVGDARDLLAYLHTLPQVEGAAPPHELSFPFNIRRSLGGWKLLYGDPDWVVAEGDPQVLRGRFLVEGPGHCGECHTPRDALGGLDRTRWLKGAPSPDGPGMVPDISPSGIGDWSAEDVAYYLESGFTPEYDSVGGAMVEVVKNMGHLGPEDRAAIAAYLKALPQ